MQRVAVVGNSGSGKSRLAAALARDLQVPYVELDAIFHQPGWTELAIPEFCTRVAAAINGDGWVVDGNYTAVQHLIWRRADTVVWLDLPRWLVTGRIIRRTLIRALRRRELWNGNRENWRNIFSTDPLRSIIVWSWTQHAKYQTRYRAAMVDPAWDQLRFIQLGSARDVTAWMTAARRDVAPSDPNPREGCAEP